MRQSEIVKLVQKAYEMTTSGNISALLNMFSGNIG